MFSVGVERLNYAQQLMSGHKLRWQIVARPQTASSEAASRRQRCCVYDVCGIWSTSSWEIRPWQMSGLRNTSVIDYDM